MNGDLVWYTSLAAEYHIEMVETCARDFKYWLDNNEEELKDNAEPIRFAAQMKMRREAAAQVAATAHTMEAKQLKNILQVCYRSSP